MRKIKNIIIYSLVCVIISLSLKMPEILFEIENQRVELGIYEKEKAKSVIDVEAEKIYLVRAIHGVESEMNSVSISPNKDVVVEAVGDEGEMTEKIYKELIKLKEYHILENFEVDENTTCKVRQVNKFYQKEDNVMIMLHNVFLGFEDNEFNLEIESKTGKILYLVFEKKNLPSNREEIMENYIKYLDLYIIDDWKMENNMLKSEKAKLMVNLVQSDDYCILSIHSSDRVLSRYESVDIAG